MRRRIYWTVSALALGLLFLLGYHLVTGGTRSSNLREMRALYDRFTETRDQIWLEKIAMKMRDGNEDEKFLAAYYLGEAGPQAANFLPDLCNGLIQGNHFLRRQCAVSIESIGASASGATHTLIECIKNEPMKDVRYMAMSTLAEVSDPVDPTALDFLRQLLETETRQKREVELMILRIEERKREATPSR